MGRVAWDFSDQLQQFGPTGSRLSEPLSVVQAEAYCRSVALTHYENFQIASFLIPRLLRQDFFNIYAYCRWSDDCADEAGSRQSATALLHWWQSQLDQLFDQQTAIHPVMRALLGTIQRHHLPKAPFADLLSAFRQDQQQLRYDSFEQLEDYCQRSANPVGRLVLGLAQAADDPENLRLSDHICTGLQLANFCQDMQRDAVLGRIYAPIRLWQRYGVSESMILAGQVQPELQSMLREFVSQAQLHFDAGQALAQRVPKWLSKDIRLFRAGGVAILDQIRKCNYDVWTARPTVSKVHKVALLLRVLLSSQ